MLKDFMNGRESSGTASSCSCPGRATELADIPLYVAAYGPKALAVAGRASDGVIIQLADPVIIEWLMATAREAAEAEGRDPLR